jgi:hypothetical protein
MLRSSCLKENQDQEDKVEDEEVKGSRGGSKEEEVQRR